MNVGRRLQLRSTGLQCAGRGAAPSDARTEFRSHVEHPVSRTMIHRYRIVTPETREQRPHSGLAPRARPPAQNVRVVGGGSSAYRHGR